MRKQLLAIMLAAPLPGCLGLGEIIDISTISVTNPITLDMLNDFEAVETVAFAGLGAYKKSCIRGDLPPSCKGVVISIQGYTRQLPPLQTSLRTFVRNNDQVNAKVVFTTIKDLIARAKSVATANGIAVGGA